MEYDRALFRVYERIMEDLNASPSPLTAPTPSLAPSLGAGAEADRAPLPNSRAANAVASRDGEGLRRRRGNSLSETTRGDGGDENEATDRVGSDDVDANGVDSREDERRAGRTGRVTPLRRAPAALRRQRRHQPLPFLLPIPLARSLDSGRDGTAALVAWAAAGIDRLLRPPTYVSVATSPSPRQPGCPSPQAEAEGDVELHRISQLNGTLGRTPSPDSSPGAASLGLRRRSPSRRDGQGQVPSAGESTPPPPAGMTPPLPSLSMRNDSTTSSQHSHSPLPLIDSLSSRQPNSGFDTSSSDDDDSGSTTSSEMHAGDDNRSGSSASSDDGDYPRERRSNESGCSQRNLYRAMRLCLALALFHFFVLISLHATYVGPHAFRRQKTTLVWKEAAEEREGRLLGGQGDDGLVSGALRSGDGAGSVVLEEEDVAPAGVAMDTLHNCLSFALSSRPVEDRSRYFGEDKEGETLSDSNAGTEKGEGQSTYRGENTKENAPPLGPEEGDEGGKEESGASDVTLAPTIKPSSPVPLFGKDEILQIKIMYGVKCLQCSRVHTVEYPAADETSDKSAGSGDMSSNNTDHDSAQETQDGQRHSLRGRRQQAKTKEVNSNATAKTDANEPSSPSYWEKPYYRFAIDDALLYMDAGTRYRHNITVVNVTVTERCLSTGSDDGTPSFLTATGEFLSQIYGIDSVIINQLMYGIRGPDGAFTSGHVKNLETEERWGWHKEQLEAFEHGSFVTWLMRKIGVVTLSTLAFFLITSVTSLIVRVLTSSGVVLMFPLFSVFRALGVPGADERILSLSYPWIGSARAAIANQRVHPQSHLVWANLAKIFLYYVMYEACQAAWSVVLYAKSIPASLPVWIYGIAMIWEYFSMIFIRSVLSVHFFPRVTFLYFFLYHVYFYSIPYGYFDVALIPLFLLSLHSMLYVILGLECIASARGFVSVECPREVYNRLSWQEPVAALPAEWTIFLPLNSRLSPLHDRDISDVTQDNENDAS